MLRRDDDFVSLKITGSIEYCEEIGTDEVQLIPTSSDLDQVRRAAEVANRF